MRTVLPGVWTNTLGLEEPPLEGIEKFVFFQTVASGKVEDIYPPFGH
jgi:hypothetical protein